MPKSQMRNSFDNAVSPVIATVAMIALVIICLSIVMVTLIGVTANSAENPPLVHFRTSANSAYVYHTGGETLLLEDLIFYDEKGDCVHEIVVYDGDSRMEGVSLWFPGQYAADKHGLQNISVIVITRNGNDHLIYRAAAYSVLPVGSMVPDWWEIPEPTQTEPGETEGPEEPETPTVEEIINEVGGILYYGTKGDTFSLQFGTINVNTSLVPESPDNYYVYFILKYDDGTHYILLDTSGNEITLRSGENGNFMGKYIGGSGNKDLASNFIALAHTDNWEVHVEVVHKDNVTGYHVADYTPDDVIARSIYNCIDSNNVFSWENRK